MKKKTFILLSILAVFLMTNCASQNKTQYIYSDGNNNVYKVEGNSIAYDPMTPERSSSGLYSGGEKKSVKISDNQKQKLINIFNTAIENKSMQIEKRVKASGMLTITKGKDKKTYIFGARSKSRADIESILKGLINMR